MSEIDVTQYLRDTPHKRGFRGKVMRSVANVGAGTIIYRLTDGNHGHEFKVDEHIGQALGFQRSCMGWHFSRYRNPTSIICYGNGAEVWVDA